jgi:hypothetical protein
MHADILANFAADFPNSPFAVDRGQAIARISACIGG